MTPHSSLEHDLALKRFASTPKDRKPNYPWREAVREQCPTLPDVQVACPQGLEPFDLGEIADTVGKSLTTLLLARGHAIGTADGMIGTQTRRAIVVEQQRLGLLPADGRAGTKILAALKAEVPPVVPPAAIKP